MQGAIPPARLSSRSRRRAKDFPPIQDVLTEAGFRAWCRQHGFRHPLPEPGEGASASETAGISDQGVRATS
ncbi:MAG: hypothetical protein D6757_01640 [Alphaproteobacteria bacterium]|nr:MAG: hypothetical protein D6757_01640 [Alphaproteobacteria bacterium]